MMSESAVRWLSYDELAEARGIDRASAIRMVRRKRWPKQESNDGTTRVAVPASALSVTGHPATNQAPPDDKIHDLPGDNNQIIKALEAELAGVREALSRERDRADRLQAERDTERERADQAAAEREAARIEAAFAKGEVKGLLEALARERERADGSEAVAALVPGLLERAGRGEGEAKVLREAVAREVCLRELEQAARKTAERERDAARARWALP
jgi:hypothetical protein